MGAPLGAPRVVASCICGPEVVRAELDFAIHFIAKSSDEVMQVTEDDDVVGYTYFLRDFDHLSLAEFAARSLSRIAFNGFPIVAHVEHEESPPEVKKRGGGAKPKRGGARLY